MANPYKTLLAATLYGELHHQIWFKGHVQVGYDPDQIRKDDFGFWIHFDAYGNRNSAFGWELDHIRPVYFGGSDDASNLRPLHWRANVKLGGLLR